jgi:hypothetical protein
MFSQKWIVHSWLPLRLVYPTLPVSLDCPRVIAPSSCVPYVTSFSWLSTLDSPRLIVHSWLPLRLVYTTLPFSLDCPLLIAPCPLLIATLDCSLLIVHSWLSTLDCPLLIVHFWLPLRLVYPTLPVFLDCPLLIAPSVCSNVYSYYNIFIINNIFSLKFQILCIWVIYCFS